MKYCTGCGERFPTSKLKDNLCLYCQRKSKRLKNKYSLNLEQYNQLLEKQNDRCAICEEHMDDLEYALHVDHDHKTLSVRGLLCRTCNLALGLFKDSPLLLKKALRYLSNRDSLTST